MLMIPPIIIKSYVDPLYSRVYRMLLSKKITKFNVSKHLKPHISKILNEVLQISQTMPIQFTTISVQNKMR